MFQPPQGCWLNAATSDPSQPDEAEELIPTNPRIIIINHCCFSPHLEEETRKLRAEGCREEVRARFWAGCRVETEGRSGVRGHRYR